MFVSTLRHRILIIMLVSFIRGTCRNISKHLFHGFLFHNTGIVRPKSQGNVGDCEMLNILLSPSVFQMRKKGLFLEGFYQFIDGYGRHACDLYGAPAAQLDGDLEYGLVVWGLHDIQEDLGAEDCVLLEHFDAVGLYLLVDLLDPLGIPLQGLPSVLRQL